MQSESKYVREARRATSDAAAARAWKRAYRAEPNNPEAVIGYSDVLIQARRADVAIPLLESLVNSARSTSDAHALLGEAYLSTGAAGAAADQFQIATLFDPDSPELHNNLSVALLKSQRFEEAASSSARAVELDPKYKDGLLSHAAALQHLGRNDEAIVSLRRAAETSPDDLEAWERLGTALRSATRPEEARAAIEECVRLAPGRASVHFNLAVSYWDEQRWSEAEPHFRTAVRLDPSFTDAHAQLASTYVNLRRYPEAIAQYRRVLALDPNHNDALGFLPYCYMNMGRLGEAAPLVEDAVVLATDQGMATNLEGMVFEAQARMEEAICCGRRVVREHPGRSDSRHNLSLWLLSLGYYNEGFLENEWRLRDRSVIGSTGGAPYWDGVPIPGQTLAAVQEQGIGDTIMFARYLPLVKERVGTLKLMCVESIAPVIATIPGIDELIAYRYEDPPTLTRCDARVCLPSLPHLFRATLETIPPAPYVTADPVRALAWRERLARDGPGLKIGLVWAGSPEFQSDAIRSPGIESLAPLASLPGVRYYSLQVGAGRDQLRRCPTGLAMEDLGPDLTDFGETAAALEGLDLLISSCTSIVHLAGALGVQAWVALPYSPDWRWMWNRSDSPWYPSLRLFRQPNMGDWRAVYTRMAEELTRYSRFSDGG